MDKVGRNPLKSLCAVQGLVFLGVLTYALVMAFISFEYTRNLDWSWVGGVSSTEARFRVRAPAGAQRSFIVAENSDLSSGVVLSQQLVFGDGSSEVQPVVASGLKANTKYFYGQKTGDGAVVWEGSFSTPSQEGTPMEFLVATAGCALTGSKHRVFESIAGLSPLALLHAGDMHYADYDDEGIDERITAYDRVLASKSQKVLYSSVFIAYALDDHDYCGNNANAGCLNRAAARQAYQKAFPHYDLAASPVNASAGGLLDVSNYQAFTIGTVRFILTDLRSEAIESTDNYEGSIYSQEQKDWLYAELTNSSSYDFVVWLSTKPWIGQAERGGDSWRGFEKDRKELSNHIAATVGQGKKNLLMVSSDAHMVAFDDGSNTDYSDKAQSAGFPLIQSGPLHNIGSVKGGPFTEGTCSYRAEMNSQFSTLDFSFPEAGEPCITITSYRQETSKLEELFTKKLCGGTFKDDRSASVGGSCPVNNFISTEKIIVFSVAMSLMAIMAGTSFVIKPANRRLVLRSLALTLFVMTFTALAVGGTSVLIFFMQRTFYVPTEGFIYGVLVQSVVCIVFLLVLLSLSSNSGPEKPVQSFDVCRRDLSSNSGPEKQLGAREASRWCSSSFCRCL